MEQLHRLEAVTTAWPTGLRTAEEVAPEMGIPAERLISLADGGYAPHYRIDGTGPFFRITELKQWAARNLVQHEPGRDLPSPIRVVLEPRRIADLMLVPEAIREVQELRDITGELSRAGIYFLCHGKDVVYVGQSINVAGRLGEHRKTKFFERIYFLAWPLHDLDRVEAALIRALEPYYNRTSTDRGAPSNPEVDDAMALAEIGLRPAAEGTNAGDGVGMLASPRVESQIDGALGV